MATNVINIRRFVDVSTGVQATPADVRRDWGAVLFVMKGTDDQSTDIKKYADLAEVVTAASNTEAAKCATQFYGTGYNGIVPNSPFFVATISAKDVDDFTTNFTPLLESEEYYLVLLDSTLEVDIRKAAAQILEASLATTSHRMFLEDYSADAANKTLEDDTTSLLAYCANNNYNGTMTTWVNPTNTNKYYGASLAAFFATRQFNNSDRRMASVAHKAASGVSPVDLLDASVTVSPTTAFDNIDSKNGNVYANIKIVGLPAWERGNAASGDDMSDFISADYLNYTIAISVFNALQVNPRIPMNNDGAVILANAIELAFEQLSSAGVISGGVSLDGEAFPTTGYKISIPVPTGVARANGLWENIICTALLAGSAKRVVISNTLKK